MIASGIVKRLFRISSLLRLRLSKLRLLIYLSILRTRFGRFEVDSSLFEPRYIALDSSHLSQWIRASLSPSVEERKAAKTFEEWLERNGCLPLLTLHHISELCAYDDTQMVAQRLRFLHRQKLIAWISQNDSQPSIGGVTTILASEVQAAFQSPDADVETVLRLAAKGLIAAGTGEDLLGPDPHDWLDLIPIFAAQNERAREIVALTHTDVIDTSKLTLRKLMNSSRKTGDALKSSLELMQGTYFQVIKASGDKRIDDPESLAQEFMEAVRAFGDANPGDAKSLVFAGLAEQGIEPSDLHLDMTVDEALELGVFFSQIRTVAEGKGLPWQELKKRVRKSNIPSSVVVGDVAKFLPTTVERKGSELNDMHLATLAPYADVTFVDKRMHHAFRQAFRKNKSLEEICSRVERASSYRDIPQIVDSL